MGQLLPLAATAGTTATVATPTVVAGTTAAVVPTSGMGATMGTISAAPQVNTLAATGGGITSHTGATALGTGVASNPMRPSMMPAPPSTGFEKLSAEANMASWPAGGEAGSAAPEIGKSGMGLKDMAHAGMMANTAMSLAGAGGNINKNVKMRLRKQDKNLQKTLRKETLENVQKGKAGDTGNLADPMISQIKSIADKEFKSGQGMIASAAFNKGNNMTTGKGVKASLGIGLNESQRKTQLIDHQKSLVRENYVNSINQMGNTAALDKNSPMMRASSAVSRNIGGIQANAQLGRDISSIGEYAGNIKMMNTLEDYMNQKVVM